MREWIPVSTSAKGRLALAAVREFGARPFDEVSVTELAAAADVTTGALYHHFGNKLGLYDVVRADVEQRLLDRMAGALAASTGDRGDAVTGALLVGLDFAVAQELPRLLGAHPVGTDRDRVAELLGGAVASWAVEPSVLGDLLAAAWRAAVDAVAEGAEPARVRAALSALAVRPVPGPERSRPVAGS